MGKVEVLVVKDCCASPTASVGNLVGINQIRREKENIVQMLNLNIILIFDHEFVYILKSLSR